MNPVDSEEEKISKTQSLCDNQTSELRLGRIGQGRVDDRMGLVRFCQCKALTASTYFCHSHGSHGWVTKMESVHTQRPAVLLCLLFLRISQFFLICFYCHMGGIINWIIDPLCWVVVISRYVEGDCDNNGAVLRAILDGVTQERKKDAFQ